MSFTSSVLNRRRAVPSLFFGLFIGVNAALPMYLWQSNAQLAVACFIIVSYTAWLVAATWHEIVDNYTLHAELHTLPINRVGPRIKRMLMDPGFWWSLMFGGATVTGAIWYGGYRQSILLIIMGGLWAMISFLLNFGLTLVQPTTCCRRCGYNLISHMDPGNPEEVVRCPECGSSWAKASLFLAKPAAPLKRKAA